MPWMTIIIFLTLFSLHMKKIPGYTPHSRKEHVVSLFPPEKKRDGEYVYSLTVL